MNEIVAALVCTLFCAAAGASVVYMWHYGNVGRWYMPDNIRERSGWVHDGCLFTYERDLEDHDG